MIDIVVDGKRINWAGQGANRFYEKPKPGWTAPSEPNGYGPPLVAAQLTDPASLDAIQRAAALLKSSIAEMHPSIMALDDATPVLFDATAGLRGDQIKSLWQHGRFVVNDFQYAASRGGATVAGERLSHIRHNTVTGYAAHVPGGLHFIILHEFMHMTGAGIASFTAEFAAYEKASGDSSGKNYDDRSAHFRRTEQFVNSAARKVMLASGLKVPHQTYPDGPASRTKDNMPPYGYIVEPER